MAGKKPDPKQEKGKTKAQEHKEPKQTQKMEKKKGYC
jgi:hypothetical protein